MLKYISLFSGIGAFEKALFNIGVPYELINYCEIDKYASKAYSLIHHIPESKNLWDITKVDETTLPSDVDLITYGFPCQDISIAGKKRGFVGEDGKKTRSGLFFDALRIIEHCKPKVAIAENVKNLASKSMKGIFDIVLNSLNEAGYNCYWKVMNAADYGIPQSRERVIIVSIRKDIDNGSFQFPDPIQLTRCLAICWRMMCQKHFIFQKIRPEASFLTMINTLVILQTGGDMPHAPIKRLQRPESDNCAYENHSGGRFEPLR